MAGEQNEEDDATGPCVGLGPVVPDPVNHLGCRVRRSPASCVEEPVFELLGQSRESEVRDLEVAVAIEEEVLGLDVAVSHAVFVAETHGGDELLEVAARYRLRQFAVAGDFGEELAAGGELDDDVDLGFGGHDLVDFEDVGVVLEAAHSRDLPEYQRLHTRVGFELVYDFDGHRGCIDQGLGSVDLGEAAPAQKSAHLVLAEERRGGGEGGDWWLATYHGLVGERRRTVNSHRL